MKFFNVFLNAPIPASFFVYFRSTNLTRNDKSIDCAWDLKPEWQDSIADKSTELKVIKRMCVHNIKT